MQTEEHVTLTCQQDHFEVFQVSQKEHTSVHHVQQALVYKLVLVLHNWNYALLDSKSHWNIKHVVFRFILCLNLFLLFLTTIYVLKLPEYCIHTILERCLLNRVILPVSFLALQGCDLGNLVFQVPCLSFAVDLLFLVDELKDSIDQRFDEDWFDEAFLFEAGFLWLMDDESLLLGVGLLYFCRGWLFFITCKFQLNIVDFDCCLIFVIISLDWVWAICVARINSHFLITWGIWLSFCTLTENKSCQASILDCRLFTCCLNGWFLLDRRDRVYEHRLVRFNLLTGITLEHLSFIFHLLIGLSRSDTRRQNLVFDDHFLFGLLSSGL